MGTGIIHVVDHVHEYIKFFQVFPQKSSVHQSNGTVWKSSSSSSELSEHTGVLSGVWLSTELEDKCLHTGLGGFCGVVDCMVW